MGIYDRDYYRPEQRGFSLRTPRTVIGTLIAINVAVWLIDGLFMQNSHWLVDQMAVRVNTLTQPWMWWQFLTYAFAHDPNSFAHIFGNMLVLFFLGPPVEQTYGPKEFLRFYLVTAVVAAVVWAVLNKFAGTPGNSIAVGASGALAGVVILFALNYPHQTVLLFFVFPIPAWLLGVIVVGLDMLGALGYQGGNIAYSMHLTGAAFAFLYFKQRWNLGRLLGGGFSWPRLQSPFRPRLRVHRPPKEAPDKPDTDLSQEVDRILEKIYREGEASLTAKERRTLETASRQYQQRR